MAEEHDEMMARVMRDRRRSAAVVAVFAMAAGAFLVFRQSGNAPTETRVLGGVFLLMGAVALLWIWQRDWSPPDAERVAQQLEMSRRVGLLVHGLELLTLLLALLGLVFPAEFGEYWQKHQFIILLLGVGVVSGVIFRVGRWRAARIADSELP